MEKKLLPSHLPATYIAGSYRHYINVYYTDKKGVWQHKKPTFSLNRITNLPERRRRGWMLQNAINYWLDNGFAFEDFDERLAVQRMADDVKEVIIIKTMSVLEAIEMAKKFRIADTERKGSQKTLRTHANVFSKWLKATLWDDLPVDKFSPMHAMKYIEYWTIVGKITNANTHNTKLSYMKSYFQWMVGKEIIKSNPFKSFKPRRTGKANVRNLEADEMCIIADAAKVRNVWMWCALKLAFWGLVRQSEMQRLKFEHFDFDKWVIIMPMEVSKNWKEDIITLPKFLKEEFESVGFMKKPKHFFVFGKDLAPGEKSIHESKFYHDHAAILKKLKDTEVMPHSKGLSFRSWRKTGMDYFSNHLHPRQFKDHNRHESFATTEKYLPNRKFIKEVSVLPDNIFLQKK